VLKADLRGVATSPLEFGGGGYAPKKCSYLISTNGIRANALANRTHICLPSFCYTFISFEVRFRAIKTLTHTLGKYPSKSLKLLPMCEEGKT